MEAVEQNQGAGAILQMSAKRRWVVTAGVLLGMCLAALELTIVGTAMPTIVASLGGLKHYSWVFSAYLIASTVPVPVWGKLSDIYGRRTLYQLGIGTFLLGSILSGFAGSMTQLIIFRTVQGLGAGILVPLAMTIIGDIYTLEERTRMQAVFSGVWGVSSIVGPLLGGFITDQLSWRWVFFINVPFGLAAAAVIGVSLREPARQLKPKIDFAGALTLIIAVTFLMLAVVEAGSHTTALFQPTNLILLALSAIFTGLFLWIETRAADPIMPPTLFSNRVVSVSMLASFFVGVAMFGAISFAPFFAQGVLGTNATAAGSLLTPLLLCWVVSSTIGGRLLLKVGFKAMALAGTLLMTLGLGALATSGRETSLLLLSVELGVLGTGLGLTVLTLLLASQTAVGRHQLGLVTSLAQFSRSIGGAIGVAVMGAVLSTTLAADLAARSREGGPLSPQLAERLGANPNALIDHVAQSTIPQEALVALQSALAVALDSAFWLGAAAALVAFLSIWWLPGRKTPPPREEACTSATGERLLMAEMTTLDSKNEPVTT